METSKLGVVTKIVRKDWGYEKWIVNNEKYCGKEIHVDNIWSSKGRYHYHAIKDETFYIIDGVLLLDIMDDRIYKLEKGEFLRIKPTVRHRFKGENGTCIFVEFSTHHDDSDTYYEE
jgi:mannose-6-phosphate isomerase-like protein (cupin superfamily)